MHQVIHLHAAAPSKPDLDQACNGCGVCCSSEPCPIGMVLSRRRTGACDALLWDGAGARYLCGLVAEPATFLPRALRWAAPTLATFTLRYISAGSGCDCSVRVCSDPPGR